MQLTLLTLLPLVTLALTRTITIGVGDGGLVFNPDTVTAAKGDVRIFGVFLLFSACSLGCTTTLETCFTTVLTREQKC